MYRVIYDDDSIYSTPSFTIAVLRCASIANREIGIGEGEVGVKSQDVYHKVASWKGDQMQIPNNMVKYFDMLEED